MVDGHMRERAIVAIDAAHNLVHHGAQLLHRTHNCLSQILVQMVTLLQNRRG